LKKLLNLRIRIKKADDHITDPLFAEPRWRYWCAIEKPQFRKGPLGKSYREDTAETACGIEPLSLRKILRVPDGQSVGIVLKELGRRNPSFQAALFDQQDHVKGFINILLNGKSLDMEHETDFLLHEGDVISFFSYVSGG
jgi:molybdopterin converting factor small subunit